MVMRHETEYLIGADPELFIMDVRKGTYRSAHDIVPGSKHSPFAVARGAIQPDGTAAEFNILPAKTVEEFTHNITSTLSSLQKIISDRNVDLRLRVIPTAIFDGDYFKTLPAEAIVFGCTPDYNAYTSKPNKFKGTSEPYRTGAGHVHLGWTIGENPDDTGHIFDCMQMTRQLDSCLYFSSQLFDSDTQRRTLYGKIGAFRPKPYGVEYRSISNAWVADPDLHIWVFNTTKWAAELLDREGVQLWEDKAVKEHINDARNDVEHARADLLDLHMELVERLEMPKLPEAYLTANYGEDK